MIGTDENEYNWQMFLYRYGRLFACMYSGAHRDDLIKGEYFGHAGHGVE